uniref:Uncharacterized protein n=1 Tax=Octopus bimaculoides TaxID=37653 RepID=A0A0L8GEP6_OCTBM
MLISRTHRATQLYVRLWRRTYKDVVKVLLKKKGNNILQVTQRHINGGGTPLHVASQEGHTDIVKLLQHNSADVSVVAVNGWTHRR